MKIDFGSITWHGPVSERKTGRVLVEYNLDPRRGPVCCERCGAVLSLQIEPGTGRRYLETFSTLQEHAEPECTRRRAYVLDGVVSPELAANVRPS